MKERFVQGRQIIEASFQTDARSVSGLLTVTPIFVHPE